MAALTISPRRRHVGLYFGTYPKAFVNQERAANFLRALLGRLQGNVIVVWDGGSNHKGPLVRAFLRRNRRVRLERLPAYAPDLNPVEAVWAWLKHGRLANFVPADVDDLDGWVNDDLVELKHDPALLSALWAGSDLPLPGRPTRQPRLPAGQ